jgi:hypothetical protein
MQALALGRRKRKTSNPQGISVDKSVELSAQFVMRPVILLKLTMVNEGCVSASL